MSNWTHVAGVIRIDDIRISNETLNFDELIGKECSWYSSYKTWDDVENNPQNYLPMGTEGSLEKSVWINPDRSCCAAYTVSIFGDLRDHENPNEIIKWFKNKINEIAINFAIRQATITVNNECNGTINWTFDYDEFYKEA